MTNYYDEETIKNLSISDIKHLYYTQYDEDQDIPAIDRIEEEGETIYVLYIYKLKDGTTDYKKGFCRIEEVYEE